MNKLILISMLLIGTLSAKGSDFENPNGRPGLLTITGTYQKPNYSIILPVSKWLTLKSEAQCLNYDCTSYPTALSEATYSIDFHIPLYKIWNKD